MAAQPTHDPVVTGTADIPDSTTRMQRRVVVASYVGSVIEWYDFFLFSLASSAVFTTLFFPTDQAGTGILLSFATLAVGYFARPIGGLIWGHFGDRVGRKSMLVLSVLLMGVATTLVGLLPTYAQVGIWAPLMLVVLRIAQGLSAGGEWAGATLMTIEHARRRRGLASSATLVGLYTGSIAATGIFTLVSGSLGDAFLDWGWRIPFLLSAVLVALGLWMRLRIDESPAFRRLRQESAGTTARKVPLWAVLRRPKNLVLSVLLAYGPFLGGAVANIVMLSYAVQLGFSRTDVFLGLMLLNLVSLLLVPVFAGLSDRVGRRPVYVAGAVLLGASGFVLIALANTRSLGNLYLALALVGITHALYYSTLGAWLSELFPTHARYTGFSLGYQLAGTLGAGLTPLAASAMLVAAGGPPHGFSVAWLLAGACLLSVIGAVLAKETHQRDLTAGDA